MAGLLPDPEGCFQPTSSHCHAWMTAVIFEILITAVAGRPQHDAIDVVRWTAEMTKTLVLSSMCIVYSFPDHKTHDVDEETTGLIESSNNVTYGSINEVGTAAKSMELFSASDGGWLSYFVGFRVLFPYIW